MMTEPLTEVIERVLPYDGPYSPDTVYEASRGVSALVRCLDNATGRWNARQTLDRAPTVDMVLGEISAAAMASTSCCGNWPMRWIAWPSTRRCATTAATGLLRPPRPAIPPPTLRIAQDRALDLAQILTDVSRLTAHLGHDLDASNGGDVG